MYRLAGGNFSNVKGVGAGVFEKKLNFGPGYRIYFHKRRNRVIVLLCGGDKSTQAKDIKTAKRLLGEWSE